MIDNLPPLQHHLQNFLDCLSGSEKQEITEAIQLYARAAIDAALAARGAVPAGLPEIDYEALIKAAYARDKKWAQGTNGCIAFKHGAEWFRYQVAAAPQQVAQPSETVDSVNETNAILAGRYFDLLKVVEAYEKQGVTCQTFRHFVDTPCAECNSVQAKLAQPSDAKGLTMLTDEQIASEECRCLTAHAQFIGSGDVWIEGVNDFARAIESAACAPLLERIAELEEQPPQECPTPRACSYEGACRGDCNPVNQAPNAQQADPMSHIAKLKLADLITKGYRECGVMIEMEHSGGRVTRGAVSNGGMVIWWHPEQMEAAHTRAQQAEAQPVAIRYRFHYPDDGSTPYRVGDWRYTQGPWDPVPDTARDVGPLYTAPPNAVPLTDEQAAAMASYFNLPADYVHSVYNQVHGIGAPAEKGAQT